MNLQQRMAKTSKAWDALASPDIIGRRAHGLLLLANGRRSERELSHLLGEDHLQELADRLVKQGFLQSVPFTAQVDSDPA